MLWHRGHFWIAIAGATLCVLRARFFRLEVRRFGTAMGVRSAIQVMVEPRGVVATPACYACSALLRSFRSASQRLSAVCAHAHSPAFRSAPHVGHSPLQSSRSEE